MVIGGVGEAAGRAEEIVVDCLVLTNNCLNMFEEQERKMTKKIVPLDFSRVVFSVQRLGQLWARCPKSGERTSFFYSSFHVFSIGSCNLVPALCRGYQNFRS